MDMIISTIVHLYCKQINIPLYGASVLPGERLPKVIIHHSEQFITLLLLAKLRDSHTEMQL